MLSANRERFNLILHNIFENEPGKPVYIDQKRDNKVIRVGKQAVAMTNDKINKTGEVSKMPPNGLRLIKLVKSCFTQYILAHLDDLILDEKTGQYTFPAILRYNSSVYDNRPLYESLPVGETVYLIDLKHAYWRIAYLKGYISEGLYLSHITSQESKLYRNMALACTLAQRKRTYFNENGEIAREIEEACIIYQTMYDNVRHTCYNAMGDVYRELPGRVLSFRTDGVLVISDGLEKAKKMLYNRGFKCRIIQYRKQDNEYLTDEQGNKKKF